MRKNLLIFRTAKGENEWSCKKVISPYLLLFVCKPVAFLFSRDIAQGCQAWVGTESGGSLRSCQSQVGTKYLSCHHHLYSQPFFIKCLLCAGLSARLWGQGGWHPSIDPHCQGSSCLVGQTEREQHVHVCWWLWRSADPIECLTVMSPDKVRAGCLEEVVF